MVENEKVLKKGIDCRTLLPIVINGTTFTAAEALEALNYGMSPILSHLASAWSYHKHLQELSHIWDRSLLTDFAKALFDNKKDVYKVVLGVNLGLCGPFEDYMATENVELLLGVLHSFRGVLGRRDFRPPNSYIVRDLIASVRYLKDALVTPALSSDKNPKTCTAELEDFWRDAMGSSKALHWRPN